MIAKNIRIMTFIYTNAQVLKTTHPCECHKCSFIENDSFLEWKVMVNLWFHRNVCQYGTIGIIKTKHRRRA